MKVLNDWLGNLNGRLTFIDVILVRVKLVAWWNINPLNLSENFDAKKKQVDICQYKYGLEHLDKLQCSDPFFKDLNHLLDDEGATVDTNRDLVHIT